MHRHVYNMEYGVMKSVYPLILVSSPSLFRFSVQVTEGAFHSSLNARTGRGISSDIPIVWSIDLIDTITLFALMNKVGPRQKLVHM